jgi:hypothetical protein
MKLIEKKEQYRRDFTGIYKCEGCGVTVERDDCYDDDYFHTTVTPAMVCGNCGESTDSLGLKPQAVATKYAPHEIV